jgi:very-short-patch-repair endonuclease
VIELARKLFRRQHPIGPFVVDFACMSGRLVIEVDGPAHDPDLDAPRQRFIEQLGWTVIRVAADEVLRDDWQVADGIYALLGSPTPTPPLRGGGLC